MPTCSFGIDLASRPAKTASCVIEWSESDGAAIVSCPVLGMTDGDLIDLAARCIVIGIDVPFGRPDPFEAFLHPDRAVGLDRRAARGLARAAQVVPVRESSTLLC